MTASDLQPLPYRLPVRVYGTDLGPYAVTDASSAMRYMDRGRVEAIETLCGGADQESWLTQYTVNVYRLDATFHTPARLGEGLEVHTDLYQKTSHRAAFDARIVNAASGDILADSTVDVLFLDADLNLAPVPESLASATGADRKPLVPQTLRFTPKRMNAQFPFRQRYRVYYEDTDTQSIAYHVTYIRFCEWAIIEFLGQGTQQNVADWLVDHQVRVTRLTARYTHSAVLGDWIEVQAGLREVEGEDRVLLELRLVPEAEGDKVAADALMELAFTDSQGNPEAPPAAMLSFGQDK